MADLLECGMEFESFDAFQAAMEQYEDTNFVQFTRTDSRSVEKAQNAFSKNYNPEIKFVQLTYCCTFGPRKAPSKSSGIRNSNTRKIDCPVRLRLSATPDGQRLAIRESKLDCHNHDISEEQYKSMSRQKQLDEETELEIYNLISMHEDKRLARMLIRDKLTKETGRAISVKDILNIEKKVGKRLANEGQSENGTQNDNTEDMEAEQENNQAEDNNDEGNDSQGEESETNEKKQGKSSPQQSASPARPQRKRREPRRFRDALENGEKVLHTSRNVVSIISPEEAEEMEAEPVSASSSKKSQVKVKEEPGIRTRGRKRKVKRPADDSDSDKETDYQERKLAIKEEMLEMEKKKMKILEDIVTKLDQIIENQGKS